MAKWTQFPAAPFWIMVAFVIVALILSVQTGGTPAAISARFFSVLVLSGCLLVCTFWLTRWSRTGGFVAVLLLPCWFGAAYLIGHALAAGGWAIVVQKFGEWLSPRLGPTLTNAVTRELTNHLVEKTTTSF